jgi:hypothetical protein
MLAIAIKENHPQSNSRLGAEACIMIDAGAEKKKGVTMYSRRIIEGIVRRVARDDLTRPVLTGCRGGEMRPPILITRMTRLLHIEDH